MFRASSSAGHPYPYSSLVRDRARTPLSVVFLCLLLFGLAGFLAYVVRQQKISLADAEAQRAQAQAETAQAKAESSRMTATAAELRLQLDRAGAAPAAAPPDAALQSRLRADQDRIADLQAQLNQARADLQARESSAAPAAAQPDPELIAAQGRLADLQSQLNQAHSDLQAQQGQAADLQARLNQANDRVGLLQQSLTEARGKADAADSQLAQARASLAKFEAPPATPHPLPVSAAFRKSGDRILVWVKNRGAAPLDLTVTATGPGTDLTRTATLKPGKTLSVGKVAPESTVAIAGTGYDVFRLVVR